MFDNHAAHLVPENEQFINDHFEPLRQPAYSCEFNSIETLWSVIKSDFRKHNCSRNLIFEDEDWLKYFVEEVCQDVPIEKVRRLELANRSYL